MIKATTEIKDEIVHNTVQPGASLEDVLVYVKAHIREWTGRSVIWDINNLPLATITEQDLRNFISKYAKTSQIRAHQKTAIVAGSDVGFGVARMYTMIAHEKLVIKLQAFRDIEGARDWIDEIEEDEIEE